MRRERWRSNFDNQVVDVLESISDAFFVLDNFWRFTYINKRAAELMGRKIEGLLYKNIWEAIPELAGTRFEKEYRRAKEKMAPIVFEDIYPSLNKWLEVRLYPFKNGLTVYASDITERKKAEEERGHAKELSDTLSKIDRALSSTLDPEEIMQIVINESAKTLGVDAASINLRQDGYWVLKYSYGLSPVAIGTKFTDEEVRASAIAAETRKSVVSNDAYHDERVNPEIMRRYSIRSFLITPLVVKDRAIGVLINSYHKAPTAFTNAQIDFAGKLAAAASVALENSRLVASLKQSEENLRRRALDLQTLNNLSRVFSQTLNLDTMLDAALDSVMDLLKVDGAAIFTLNEDRRVLRLVASRGLSEYFIENTSEIRIGDRSPGIIAKTGEPLVIEDLAEHPELEASFVYEFFSSLIGVPIKSKGKTLGVFQFGSRQRGKFTQVDKTLIEAIGNELGVAIENARLYEVERRIADTLQEALLTVPEHIDHLRYGQLYRSATEIARVGGDFYDLFEMEHGRVGLVIGDVSGKGLGAAALTSVVKDTVRAYAFEGYTPAEVMAKTNGIMGVTSDPSVFVTVFFGVLDEPTGRLTYCSAGHPPSIIVRKTGKIELLDIHSPVIWAFAGFQYTDASTFMEEGDILLLYTDGLIEARRENEFFGQDRLINFIKNLGPVSSKDLPQITFNEVMKFTGGKLADDIALMAISIQRQR